MRAEDLLIGNPSVTEVLRAVDELPQPAEADVAAVRSTIERSRSPGGTQTWPPFLEEARARLDTRNAPPATSHRGGALGATLVAAKRSFRLVGQPLINEVLRRQVEFNEAILNGLAQLHEQLQAQARARALWQAEVEERLARLEADRVAAHRPKGRDAGISGKRTGATDGEES